MKEKNEIVMLVEKYQETHLDSLLKEILKKAIFEKLSYDEYEKLYEIPNIALKKLVILKAPRELLVKILFKENDWNNIYDILKKVKINEQADELINATSMVVRKEAVKSASIDNLLKRLEEENEIEVIEGILIRLKECKISQEQMDNFIKSDSLEIRLCAIQYTSKDKLIEILQEEREKDLNVIEGILNRLKNLKISEEQADILVENNYIKVIKFAVKYASINKLIEVLQKEYEEEIFEEIISRLKECDIGEERLNTLVKAKKYAVRYASKDKLINILQEGQEKDLNVIEEILNRLKDYNISQEQINDFMKSDFWEVRICAARYASIESLIEGLEKERNAKIIDVILSRIKNHKISEEQANILINANSSKVRKYAIKRASIEAIIERLEKEKNLEVIDEIIKQIYFLLDGKDML